MADFAQILQSFMALDPETKETIDLAQEIVREEASRPRDPSESPPHPGDFLPYLKAIRFYQKNRWILPVGVGVAALGLMTLGGVITKKVSK